MTYWTSLSARASFASHRLVGWIYWDPVAVSGCAELGIELPAAYYLTSRGAPLAPAGHQAVAAAYYTIDPVFIELAMGLVDERTTYEAITEVRNRAVVEGLRSYVPEICDGLAALAGPLWEAADSLPVSGRVLFAAHRQQPRPADSLLSAWLAVNCLREWGADDAALAEAMADLESRGLATDGRVNAAGNALRDEIQDCTNRLSRRAWQHLGETRTSDFLDLVEPVGDRLVARIDETAGPEWMPAARVCRTDTPTGSTR